MNYSIGIDIGTTAAKAVAFSERGEVLARYATDYKMRHTQPDYSEQDPDEILAAVTSGIQQVVQVLHPHYPSFVSFSAAMHSLILVDEKGKLLTPCIIWADNRAAAIAETLKKRDEGPLFYHSTGVPIHPMSPLCKLLWFKENEPQLFHTAAKFIGIKEYIFHRLFNAFLIDTSIASATGLLNIKTLEWDEQVLSYVGVPSGKLSRVVSTKHVCYYNNIYTKLMLPAGTPFILGSSDGALSNIGAGAIGSHSMGVTIGTSSAVRVMTAAPQTDHRMRTFCYHANGGNYIVGGASNNGAVVLQWLKDDLLQTEDSFETLFEQAAAIEPGCDGLLMLPYILGERAPLWNAQAKAVCFGLSIRHTKAYLIRAAMEGIIYNVYSIGKTVAENKNITELYASGGFVNSSLWVQMLCDVFNVKVLVSEALETAASGAAMVGADALNLTTAFNTEVLTAYFPEQNKHQVYQKQFNKFERLYELVKSEMFSESPERNS